MPEVFESAIGDIYLTFLIIIYYLVKQKLLTSLYDSCKVLDKLLKYKEIFMGVLVLIERKWIFEWNQFITV